MDHAVRFDADRRLRRPDFDQPPQGGGPRAGWRGGRAGARRHHRVDRGATSGREGVGPRRCAERRPARRCGRAAGPARRPGLGEPRGPRRHGPGRPRPRARTVDDPREDLDARGTDHLLRRAQADRTHLRPRCGGAGGPLPSQHPGGGLRPVPSGERLRAGAGQAARGVPPGVDTLGRSAADGDLRAVRRGDGSRGPALARLRRDHGLEPARHGGPDASAPVAHAVEAPRGAGPTSAAPRAGRARVQRRTSTHRRHAPRRSDPGPRRRFPDRLQRRSPVRGVQRAGSGRRPPRRRGHGATWDQRDADPARRHLPPEPGGVRASRRPRGPRRQPGSPRHRRADGPRPCRRAVPRPRPGAAVLPRGPRVPAQHDQARPRSSRHAVAAERRGRDGPRDQRRRDRVRRARRR